MSIVERNTELSKPFTQKNKKEKLIRQNEFFVL